MSAEIVPATLDHVIAVCESLRERERKAFMKMGSEAERLVTQEVTQSFLSFAGLVDGRPLCIWGAKSAGLLSDEAYIWMLCSQEIQRYPMTFLRHSRRGIDILRPNFKKMYGFVLDEFVCSIRWLQWLGFQVEEPKDGVRAFKLGF